MLPGTSFNDILWWISYLRMWFTSFFVMLFFLLSESDKAPDYKQGATNLTRQRHQATDRPGWSLSFGSFPPSRCYWPRMISPTWRKLLNDNWFIFILQFSFEINRVNNNYLCIVFKYTICHLKYKIYLGIIIFLDHGKTFEIVFRSNWLWKMLPFTNWNNTWLEYQLPR